MSIELNVRGVPYGNFTTANAKTALDELSGSFNFTAISTQNAPLPFKNGDACEIKVDGVSVINGFIENLQIGYSGNQHRIVVQGRDKTADIIDSSISAIALSPTISLKAAIEAVLADIGNTNISVKDFSNTEDFTKVEEKINAKVGQNAFEFIEFLARKRQRLLSPDGSGNIAIIKPLGVDIGGGVQNIIGSDSNNILESNVSYDQVDRFRKYIVKSQLDPVPTNFAGNTLVPNMAAQEGSAEDDEIRPGRQLVIKAEKTSGSTQCGLRADWEARIRKTRGKVYSCSVQGFSDHKGQLWTPNRIVQVVDQFCDIDAKMLLNSVEYSFDVQSGSISTLGFLDVKAYSQDLEGDSFDKLGKNTQVPKFRQRKPGEAR